MRQSIARTRVVRSASAIRLAITSIAVATAVVGAHHLFAWALGSAGLP